MGAIKPSILRDTSCLISFLALGPPIFTIAGNNEASAQNLIWSIVIAASSVESFNPQAPKSFFKCLKERANVV